MPIINQVVKGGGGSAPAYYVEKTLDASGKLINGSNLIKLNGIKSVGPHVLANAYYGVSFDSGTTVTFGDLETVTDDYALTSMFTNASGIISITFDKLKTIGGYYTLNYFCSGLSSLIFIDMKNVETITGDYTCSSMTLNTNGLSGFNLDKLKSISGRQTCEKMFQYIKTTAISLPSLEVVYGYLSCKDMFYSSDNAITASFPRLVTLHTNTTSANSGVFHGIVSYSKNLTSFEIPSLKNIIGTNTMRNALVNCFSITSISFPAVNPNSFGDRTNQFVNLCGGIPNITLHFPSNVQSVVEGLAGYSTTAPFNATAGTVLFDLPATVILTGTNSQAYERSPKDDTAGALAWRKQDTGTEPNLVIDWTPFYTSGTTDPAVGDTIYSDSACTVAVTTIDSIA